MTQQSVSANHNKNKNLREQLTKTLSSAQRVLCIGVGGGNDAVTTLLLQAQLAHDFAFAPSHIAIAGMLPDVLDYHNIGTTGHPLLWNILPQTRRSLQGTMLSGFPEPLLAKHRTRFGVSDIWGISMQHGTDGVVEALRTLIATQQYDLVMACDVGGDFIAVPQNLEVLSPMMDAYALEAFRQLQHEPLSCDWIFGVFGLGTDGESTPAMLRQAIDSIGACVAGQFEPTCVAEVEQFYRTIVEPSRYSRTTDFTLREIHGGPAPHDNPATFRARFYTRSTPRTPIPHIATFQQEFDPAYFGKYLLFPELHGVSNPFSFSCRHGIEWFLKLQHVALRINHELQGQAYANVHAVMSSPSQTVPHSLYFGTPSRKFSHEAITRIAHETLQSGENRVYSMAFMYREDLQNQSYSSLEIGEVSESLVVVGQTLDRELVAEFRRVSLQ